MIRVVLDANQFVSALLKPGSHPDSILRLVREERIILLMSPPIFEEIRRVLLYPKISKRLNCTEYQIDQFTSKLAAAAIITPGALSIPLLEADPDDTKYLVCAVEGKADYLVSGDHHLLDLGSYQGIRIVTPTLFLATELA
jgi:uncharacterized protein